MFNKCSATGFSVASDLSCSLAAGAGSWRSVHEEEEGSFTRREMAESSEGSGTWDKQTLKQTVSLSRFLTRNFAHATGENSIA